MNLEIRVQLFLPFENRKGWASRSFFHYYEKQIQNRGTKGGPARPMSVVALETSRHYSTLSGQTKEGKASSKKKSLAVHILEVPPFAQTAKDGPPVRRSGGSSAKGWATRSSQGGQNYAEPDVGRPSSGSIFADHLSGSYRCDCVVEALFSNIIGNQHGFRILNLRKGHRCFLVFQ
jgi:hypothetical protein